MHFSVLHGEGVHGTEVETSENKNRLGFLLTFIVDIFSVGIVLLSLLVELSKSCCR